MSCSLISIVLRLLVKMRELKILIFCHDENHIKNLSCAFYHATWYTHAPGIYNITGVYRIAEQV